MKKVLFATTVLVGFAGAAFADVEGSGPGTITLKGSAEIGIKFTDVDADGVTRPNDGTLRFHHDLDMDITFSGSTDTGLSFGADIDLDEVPSGIPDESGPHTVFVSGAFGTLTMGDTDGAFDKAISEIAGGNTIEDDPEHAGWNGNSGLDGTYDGQVLRYDYAFQSLTLSLSGELDDLGAGQDGEGNPVLGIGAAFDADLGGFSLGIGVGYQGVTDGPFGDESVYGVSLTGTVSGFTVIANFSELDSDVDALDFTHAGISGEYSAGDITVGANYGQFEFDSGDTIGYGVWADYDLGGGAVFTGGLGYSDADGAVSVTTASIGMKFSF